MQLKPILHKSIVATLCVTMLFACEGNLNQINKYNQEVNVPQGIAKDINLFYTDSGAVKANLRSPKMLDYSHESFAYRVFPIGVEVDFFSSDSTKNTIVADSAVVFNDSDLVDMRHNVKIVTSDSLILTTSQLYWDTNKQWIFTDRTYTIQENNGSKNNGLGFDASQDFERFNSRNSSGVQVIEGESL